MKPCLLIQKILAGTILALFFSLPATGQERAGYVVTSLSSENNFPIAMDIDSTGRILVLGYEDFSDLVFENTGAGWLMTGFEYDLVLIRYTSEGELDTSFGNGTGMVRIDRGDDDWPLLVMALDDDSILVGGFTIFDLTVELTEDGGVNSEGETTDLVAFDASEVEPFLMKLTPAGELDATYGGGDGLVSLEPFASGAVQTILAGNAMDEIVLFVLYITDAGVTVDVSSYDQDGTRQDVSGPATLSLSNEFVLSNVTIDQEGRILIAWTALGGDFAVTRYRTDGQPDTEFGDAGGTKTVDYGDGDVCNQVVLDEEGRIYLVGKTGVTKTDGDEGYDFAVVRLDERGQVDSTYGEGGFVITDIGSDIDEAISGIFDAEQRLVVAGGYHVLFEDDRFSVARYTSAGALDSTFGDSVAPDTDGETDENDSGGAAPSNEDKGGCALNRAGQGTTNGFLVFWIALLIVFLRSAHLWRCTRHA
ncbi:MAG: hypothetical protein HYU99_07765 [Deltaproteobacteria bacterium]|nr:hypothetical protein [Deltaproteobacteria bacterium]